MGILQLLMVSALSFASDLSENVVFTPVEKKVFDTPGCLSSACALKKFTVQIDQVTVVIDDTPSFSHQMIAYYETATPEQLKDYVVVQFIKGCAFRSTLKNGNLTYSGGYTRELFGQMVPFMHKDWVIDSIDTDPAYASIAGKARHYSYVAPHTPGVYKDESTWRWVLDSLPSYPEIGVRDLPIGGYALEYTGKNASWEAANASLEFKTCLYRESDVPLVTTPEDVAFAQPIVCHEWSSSWIFNGVTKQMESWKKIHPFCQ